MLHAEVFTYSPDILNPDAIDDETRLDIFTERGVFGQGLEKQSFSGDIYVTRVARSDFCCGCIR